MPVALTGSQDALLREHDRNGFVDHVLFGLNDARLLDEGAAVVAEGLRCLLDLPGHCAAQNAVTAENAFERTLFLVEFGELLLDRNGGQTSKLAEPDFKNVVRLTISETELLNQSGFRLIAVADDLDDAVDVEKDERTTLKHVNPVVDLVKPCLSAAANGQQAEGDPLADDLEQVLLLGLAVIAEHDEVDGDVGLHRCLRKERRHELLAVDAAALGFEDEAHGLFLSRLEPCREWQAWRSWPAAVSTKPSSCPFWPSGS